MSPVRLTHRRRMSRKNRQQHASWVQVLILKVHVDCFVVLNRAGTAGIAELMIFHPVDTTAKRLMSNHGKVQLFRNNWMDSD